MDRSSCDVCALWAFAIGRSPRDHPGKTLTLRDSLARSAGSAWTTSSCSVKRTCAGSSAPMLPTIMSRGPIDLWTRTPRSIAPFSASAPSHHSLSSADFITNIAESNFRYAQLQFPIVKNIWTSSYVLVCGGLSALLLGVFHQVIDAWERRSWATIFIWIGASAITLYFINGVVGFQPLATQLVGGDVRSFVDSHLTRLAQGAFSSMPWG